MSCPVDREIGPVKRDALEEFRDFTPPEHRGKTVRRGGGIIVARRCAGEESDVIDPEPPRAFAFAVLTGSDQASRAFTRVAMARARRR